MNASASDAEPLLSGRTKCRAKSIHPTPAPRGILAVSALPAAAPFLGRPRSLAHLPPSSSGLAPGADLPAPQAESRARLGELQRTGFIDRYTRATQVSTQIGNPHKGMWALVVHTILRKWPLGGDEKSIAQCTSAAQLLPGHVVDLGIP